MAEKIGLIAELDLSKFNRNVTTYISQVGKLQSATQNVARTLSSGYSAMGNQASNSIAKIINGVSNLRTQQASLRSSLDVYRSLTQQLNSVASAATRASNSLSRVRASSSSSGGGGFGLGGIGSGIGGALSGLAGGIGGVVGGLGSGVGAALGGITSTISSAAGSFATLGSNILRSVTSIIGIVSSLAGTIVRVFGSIVGVIGGVIKAFAGLSSSIIGVVGSIIRGVTSLAGTVIRAFSSMVSGILGVIGNLASAIGIAFNTILRTVINIVGSLVRIVTQLFSSLLGGVMTIVSGLVRGIVSAFSGIVSTIGRVLSGLISSVVNIFSGLLRSVLGIVGNLVRSVVSLFGDLAKSVLGVVGSMVKSVISAFQGLVNKTIATLKGMANNILSAYQDLGGKIVQILTVATAAVTGALVLLGRQITGWLTQGIMGAAEFEQGMADIASVLRKTRLEVEPLAEQITRLGLDPDLVVSTGEAATVVEQLSRNGLEMTQILEGAAESAILLANATGGKFADAADIATMAMQMFGLEASEINRIADVSQGVINNSRIELEDWSLALGNGGAAAAALGVSFEDFATTIAGSVNLFHSARQAGTGAMNFFQRLVPITQEAADAFREVGLFTGLSGDEFTAVAEEISETQRIIDELDPRLVHYDELVQAHTDHMDELKQKLVAGNSAFFDQNGLFVGGKDAAIALATAMKDLSIEERAEFVRRTFGNDSYETFIGLVQMGEKELAGLTGSFSAINDEITIHNSAIEAAKTRTITLQARWRNLGDIWQTIQRESGAKFNDMLLNLVNRLTALTGANQQRVIDFFGELAIVFNKFVDMAMPFIERMLPALINNLEALAYYILAVVEDGDTMNGWLTHMSPGLRNFVEKVIDTVRWVRQLAGQILDFVGSLGKTFRPIIEFIFNNIELKDVLMSIAGAILLNIVPGILRLVGAFVIVTRGIAAVRKAWETDWGGIRSFFETLWPKISGPLTNFINKILTGDWGDAWKDAVNVVAIALGDLEDAVPTFFKTFVNLAHDLVHGDWKGAWQNIVQIAKTSFALITQGLDKLNTPFTDFILDVLEGDWESVWKKIGNVAIFSFEALKKGLKSLDSPFTNFIVKILEGDWQGVWDDIVAAARFTFNAILVALNEMETPLTDFLFNVLTGAWDRAWLYIQEKATLAYRGIVDGLYAIDSPVTDFLGNVLTGKWDLVWESIKSGATLAYRWVVDSLYEIDSPLSNFLANVLTGKWGLAWAQIQATTVGVLEEIKNYVPDWGDNLITLLQQIITGDWQGAWTTAKGIAMDVFDGIVTWLEDSGPWGKFAADIITGDWQSAWNTARNFVFGDGGLLDDIAVWLETQGPWGTFAADIIQGNWGEAWAAAKAFVFGEGGVFDDITEWLEDEGPWGIFVSEILQGNWGAAWVAAKNALFGPDGMFPAIGVWLASDTPWSNFASNILEGNWGAAWIDAKNILFGPEGIFTKIDTWLISRGLWGQFISDIFHGDWGKAWTDFKLLVGLTEEKIKLLKDTIYIAIGAFAIATATLISFNLRGLAAVAAGIVSLGLNFIAFIPLIAAIGVGVAALRVAWQEDFLGIQAFTGEVLKAIGTIFQVGLLLVGNLVDVFLLVMKEDWAGAWEKIQDIAKFAWQIIARAAIAGLTLIESFMIEGPGANIINWLASTFPTTLVGLEGIFLNTSSLISTVWDTVTQNLLGSQSSWGGFFSFIETTVGTAAQRIGNFIGFVDGVMQFFNAQMQSSRDAMEGLDLEGKKALALSKGDTAGADALQLEIQQHDLESTANRQAADPFTFIQSRQQAIMEAFTLNEQDIRNKAKASGEAYIDTILEVTAANKKKLEEGIIPGFIDEEQLRNRYGLGAGLVKDLFNSISEGVTGQSSWADILREPVDPSDLSALKTQFANIINQFTMPEAVTGVGGDRPTAVFNSIFDTIKGLGIDLTGDFLNKGGEAIANLGAGATEEQSSVVSIFQGIMAQITSVANGLLENFKNLGLGIGNSVREGVETSLEISSPSKVFERLGDFMGEGMVKGIMAKVEALKIVLREFATEAQQQQFYESVSRAGTAAARFGQQDYSQSLMRAGTAAALTGNQFKQFGNSLNSNYNYNTTNSPVQFGPIYVSDKMGMAEFEYRVEQVVNKMRN